MGLGEGWIVLRNPDSRFPSLEARPSQASRLFPAHLEVDDEDARAHGEEVGGDVLPAAEGGARLVAEGGAAAEGAAQEGQRPHRGVVVQRPARRPSASVRRPQF